MDNSVLVIGLSLVVTLLTSLFKSVNLSIRKKSAIATVLSIGAGTAACYQSGTLTSADVFGSIAAIYGVANFAYQFILRGTGLDNKLTNINLFGVKQEDAKAVLATAAKTEKAVRKAAPAKPAKKASPAKATTAKKTSTKGTSK